MLGHGREHLLAWYSRVDSSMKTLARGILEFDPEAQQFRPVADHPTTAPIQPTTRSRARSSGRS